MVPTDGETAIEELKQSVDTWEVEGHSRTDRDGEE